MLSKLIDHGLDRLESNGTHGSGQRDKDDKLIFDFLNYRYAEGEYHVFDCFKEYPDFAKAYETTVTKYVRKRFPS